MQYITTTELRTKSSELVNSLRKGERISLVHRSKVLGTIQPNIQKTVTIADVKAFEKFLSSIRPKKLMSRKDRDKVYRQRLMEKYG